MRFTKWISIVAGLLIVGGGGERAWATEEHLVSIYQALATSPEIPIGPIAYWTWYGGEEETTVEGMTWPVVINSPHPETQARDVNWTSLLGIGLRLDRSPENRREAAPWRLTVDLTSLKKVPEDLRESLGEGHGRAFVLERILKAAEMNLKALGIFDCRLSLHGEAAHEDLKEFRHEPVLNRVSEVWGEWSYASLPRNYPEGDLWHLAAGSLVRTEKLLTIFLILSSEPLSGDAEKDAAQFLFQLLTKIGDENFSKVLSQAESLVQERVLKQLGLAAASDPNRRVERRQWFPKTFELGGTDRP